MTRNTHRPEMHRRSPVKVSVRVATTANITLSGTQTIDGVSVIAEDRVLVKDQGTASGNGIYVCKSGAWQRSYDMDTGAEVMGILVYVREGTAGGGKLFRNTNTSEPTLGSTSLTFSEFSSSGVTYAGTSDLADVAATEAAGSATTVPRGDHVHALGIGTTKGDILARTSTGWTRLAVGTDGYVLTADAASSPGVKWAAASGSPSWAGTGDIADVAATESAGAATTTPRGDHVHRLGIGTTKGDLLVRGSSDMDRLAVGTDGYYLVADSGQSLGVKWASSAGGAIGHSYIGYNTVGGSWETLSGAKVYLKTFTLSSAGFIASIHAYVQSTSDNVESMGAGISKDNSGAVGELIGGDYNGTTYFLLTQNAGATKSIPRWLHIPVGIWLAAGTYWMWVKMEGTNHQIAYDSGSDRVYTSGGVWVADGTRYTDTDSTRNYSIRASLIQ